MKKGKITVVITIAIACFALTTIMFMQFKIVNETDITSIETMREEELRTELANWKEKYKEAETQYEEKNSKLEEYKQKEASIAESSELVEKELKQVNMYLGNTDVEGPGISITIQKDSSDEELEENEINADDLLSIVDYLKSAGAEAISINEQRILAPYVIKAIGNQTYLESVLLGNGGYVDELKKMGFNVNIEKSNKIAIPKYSREIAHKYIK